MTLLPRSGARLLLRNTFRQVDVYDMKVDLRVEQNDFGPYVTPQVELLHVDAFAAALPILYRTPATRPKETPSVFLFVAHTSVAAFFLFFTCSRGIRNTLEVCS